MSGSVCLTPLNCIEQATKFSIVLDLCGFQFNGWSTNE